MNSIPLWKDFLHISSPNDTQRTLKSDQQQPLPLPLAVNAQTVVFSFKPCLSDKANSYRRKLAEKIQSFVV
jgi:hypothetical protein